MSFQIPESPSNSNSRCARPALPASLLSPLQSPTGLSSYPARLALIRSIQAQDLAARMIGVREVRCSLAIRNITRRKTDGEISEAIQRDFWRTPVVYVRSAAVSVKDGVATLKGIVESFQELERAREKAYDAGAKRVRNYLEVETDAA